LRYFSGRLSQRIRDALGIGWPQMARITNSLEVLAPREDVWTFLAEPYHLADWWPGVRGVQPDRRGLAPGARWLLNAGPQTGGLVGAFLRRPETAQHLVVMDVRQGERVR